MNNRTLAGAAIAVAFGIAACGDSTAPEENVDVSIAFAAEVGGSPFVCGTGYTNVGTTNVTVTPVDFRMYVHGVELLEADGSATPVELDQDGLWQLEDLALLDFENGSGPCANGTTAMNTTVTGTVPAGDYTGLRFILGVPEDMNHQDQTAASAPLDVTGLFWSWNGGYKFARIDHVSGDQPNGWNVHLGSTGCTPSGDPTVPATSCSNPHRVTVTFTGFDAATDVVVADYARLLSGSDVSVNDGGAPGCMSFPGDPECAAVMNRLGLDYEGATSTGQVFFEVR